MKNFTKLDSKEKQSLSQALASSALKSVIAATKAAADEDTGTFDVIVSTEDVDRHGESVAIDGWDLSHYQKNGVVLWGHDYGSLPIGICTSIAVEDGKLRAQGKFVPESAYPFAQQVRRLYDLGAVKATSVGFIAHEVEGMTITKAELLEFSFVPVPANPYCLTLEKAGFNVRELITKGLFTGDVVKEAIPFKDEGVVDGDYAWDAAKELEACGDDVEKLKTICAWCDAENADAKESYKLPHHRAEDGKAVWEGVEAAMKAVVDGSSGVPDADLQGVYNHLAKHYVQFEKEAPELGAEAPEDGAEDSDDDAAEEDKEKTDVMGAVVALEEAIQAIIKGGGEMEKQSSDASVAFNTAKQAIQDILDAEAAEEGDEEGGTEGKSIHNKEGRVLSDKNRKLIQGTIESLVASTAALKELHDATEPKGSEGKSQADDAEAQRSKSKDGEVEGLNEFLLQRDLVKMANNATSKALELFNKAAREHANK